jgi:hypothetical protein
MGILSSRTAQRVKYKSGSDVFGYLQNKSLCVCVRARFLERFYFQFCVLYAYGIPTLLKTNSPPAESEGGTKAGAFLRTTTQRFFQKRHPLIFL